MHRSGICILASTILAACSAPAEKTADTAAAPVSAAPASTAPALGSGEALLAVDGGRIWYKASGAKTGIPVILVHGGPGFNSFYLKPLEVLGDERPVVRYDQLGAGKSDGLTDTTKMNIAHFVAELDSLRAHLGYDKVHLFGHSWGSILVMEYYRAHPEHVQSLSMGGPVMSVPAYAKSAKALVKTLSDSAQKAIAAAEASGTFDAPAYQHAMEEFYGKYVWLRPIPADLDSTMKMVNQTIYNYMQGPSEFTITGTFKDYDATPFLPKVKVPLLYTVGDKDEVGPDIVKRHAALTPGATYVLLPNSAHLSPWDNPEALLRAVREHLKKADPK